MKKEHAHQLAIEDYLEALLHEDLQPEVPDTPVKSSASRSDAWQTLEVKAQAPTKEAISKPLAPEPQTQVKSEPVATKPIQDYAEPELAPVMMPELQVSAQSALDSLTQASQIPTATAETDETLVQTLPEEGVQRVSKITEHTETVTETSTAQTTEEALQEVAVAPPAPPRGWQDGRPTWAQSRFECLLFKVKGLTLAVPLVELGGIHKITKDPTPLFGQPKWFIGLLRTSQHNIRLVDTAQWVLPEHITRRITTPYTFAISIHNSEWGLACNEVAQAISLVPEQVRWRTQLGRRPWLAGTVIEHMCALIDVAAFDRLLEEGHGELEPANLNALDKAMQGH
ncbi:purine-binding chemotaxis protein CheW [Allopseudospirillum japonicum]|uniref:Purine-binding chemotaxis protein CheW n=1 Tax=Allopseudospirillum japonicum TaxID=64971 RepID=A0A1H6QQJ5_9GAMM|nr:chemotaxis protein CheW [Allopseudospirillum japonicum]SEI46088.1 purine-binding chemotaxis protein CheW [Allopseudospirillum japonicum]